MPTNSVEVLNVATPLTNAPLPIVAAPSLKSMLPVAVPIAGATVTIVAVSVILWPKTIGFAVTARLALLAARLTVWTTVAETPPPKFRITIVNRSHVV